MAAQKDKLTLVVLSGDFDKVFAAFTIASGAAATGMPVTMFFTFWGLKAIQTGKLTGKGLFARMAGLMNRGGLGAIGPSRLNMGGLGRWMFKLMMKQKGVAGLPELRQAALDLGVQMMPCETSMQVLEITSADLIPEATAPVGVATMLEQARESGIQMFI
jgi:peroxiredoxin family protein